MPLTLITGPAGSGKTAAAVELLGRFSPLELAKSVRYVVPTQEEARDVERLLMARLGVSGLLGNIVCTFFSFAGDIVSREGLSGRLISDVKKELMLRKLVGEAAPEYLGRSADSPGFIRALDRIIGELKSSLVDPLALRAALAAAARELPPASVKKITELCELYERYQDDILLANNYHDHEGQMWRALELAAEGAVLDGLKAVVFDGFNRMNMAQRRFLEILAGRVPEAIVAMTYDKARPEIFAPARETHQFVLSLGAAEVALTKNVSSGVERPAALRRLADEVFRNRETGPSGANEPDPNSPRVVFIEGCDTAMEVELAAEEMLRLTARGDCEWGDILVTARDPHSYRERVANACAENGIPLAEPKRPLAETALARLVVSCLNIIRDDWPRDEVARVLKSEFLTDDPARACEVEIEAGKLALVGGRDQWLDQWSDDDRDVGFRRAILRPLIDFASDMKKARSLPAMTEATKVLAQKFKPRAHDSLALAEDTAATECLLEILREIEETSGLLGPIGGREFFSRLEELLSLGDYQPLSPKTNAVRMAPVTGIGGQKYKAVFLLGMLEKTFPRAAREEPFLRDKERAALNRYLKTQAKGGLLDLRSAPGQAEERLHFYTAVSSATERLYLCYPLTNTAAKDSLPSFFLDEVENALGAAGDSASRRPPRIRRDHAALIPPVQAVFGRTRLDRSVVYSLAHSRADDELKNGGPATAAVDAYNQLVAAAPAFWSRVWRDADETPAALKDPRVLEIMAADTRRLRCTELEVYAGCPFSHFCAYTLRLKAVPDEVGPLDFGSLVHDVLYEFFSELRSARGDKLELADLDKAATTKRALELLESRFQAESRLRNMPPYESGLLLHELRTSLGRYLAHEVDEALPGFVPTFFELEFGSPGAPGRARDERSTEKALVLGEGEREVSLSGKMDRVDIGPAGALVIDYKTGAAPNLSKYWEGLNFQPLIYAKALKEVFGVRPVGAEYRPVRKWKPDCLYSHSAGITGRSPKRCLDDDEFDAALEACAEIVCDLASRLRAGRIEIEPRACPAYCDFAGVCRRDKRDVDGL